MTSPSSDLLSVAERFLQGDGEGEPAVVADDILSQAARAIAEQERTEEETAEGMAAVDLPSFDEALAKAERLAEESRSGG